MDICQFSKELNDINILAFKTKITILKAFDLKKNEISRIKQEEFDLIKPKQIKSNCDDCLIK